jgi:hypothetical protein
MKLAVAARDIVRETLEIPPENTPDYPFTTDGCSGMMSWLWWTLFGEGPPWEGCCIAHDRAYWMGGTAEQRRVADRQLRECVAAKGYPFVGWIMEKGVRLGGGPLWPIHYRWGYGWRWPRGYRGGIR